MTTTEITWGDPIEAANDGKPLPWLKEDEKVLCKFFTGWDGPYPVYCITGWKECFQIKLPADHPYYLATSRGFTYWPGGENAPDADEVMFRSGEVESNTNHNSWFWGHNGLSRDIIGYRKRVEPVQNDDDYVRVKRMTLAEYQRDDHGSCAWARRVGIIRDETLLEQFERETQSNLGDITRKVAKAAIEWMEKRNG